MSRVVMIFLVILFLSFGVFFFISSSSYQTSLQARVYYFLGNYKSANEYAKKAYDDDKYNKMAFYVLTQSEIALSYQDYIKRGKDYLKEIEKISAKKSIKKADESKIKMICEVMIGEFENLKSSKLMDEKLRKNANNTYKKFKQINNKLF